MYINFINIYEPTVAIKFDSPSDANAVLFNIECISILLTYMNLWNI